MSWEFRIFVPIESATCLCSVLDQILTSGGSGGGLFPSSASSSARSGQMLVSTLLASPSKRTDDYILLHQGDAASFGIKVRGRKQTEVKLRKGVVPDCHSSIEKWKKSTNTSKHNMGTTKWHKDMSCFLWKHGVLPVHTPVQITKVVSMAKTREQHRYQNAFVTVDVLRCWVSEGVSEGQEAPSSPSHSTWLSISLEGGAVDVQEAVHALGVLRVTTALTQLGGTCVYGGYPSFAAFLGKEKNKELEGKTTLDGCGGGGGGGGGGGRGGTGSSSSSTCTGSSDANNS